MALVPLGIFFGGIITGIPVVTGVAEGVSHQKKVNEDAADDERMVKFWIDVKCAGNLVDEEVEGGRAVVEGGKVWIQPASRHSTSHKHHSFTGFFIAYPDENRFPSERGLVSTLNTDPPMLNWIFVDKETLELRHGNRTQSIAHVVGDWDWTECYKDEESGNDKARNLTLDGWEGFVAIEEHAERRRGNLKWALYFDQADDGLKGVKHVRGRRKVEIELVRVPLPDELRRAQEEAAERKMQVKQSGDLKTTLNLRDDQGNLSKAYLP